MATHASTENSHAYITDEATENDQLGREAFVQKIGDELIYGHPPRVVGVHGEWGAGKTSTLRQIKNYLDNQQGGGLYTMWFDAWQYHQEQHPIVALLHGMRTNMDWWAKSKKKTAKLLAVTSRALLTLETVTKAIGISARDIQQTGEAYEASQLARQLPTDQIRELLSLAIKELLGQAKNRLVVFIDDLDRCEPGQAYQMLQGLKIYLNLEHCLFVLGMDQRQIEEAIVANLKCPRTQRVLRAREYMEKICQRIHHLPLITQPHRFLNHCLEQGPEIGNSLRGALVNLAGEFHILPANPRKIKGFAQVLPNFAAIEVPSSEHEPVTQGRRAAVVLLMAALYYFHAPIFKRLVYRPGFRNELMIFANTGKHNHPLFQHLEQTKLQDETTATPALPNDPRLLYPHHSDAAVFRLALLLQRFNPTEAEIKAFAAAH